MAKNPAEAAKFGKPVKPRPVTPKYPRVRVKMIGEDGNAFHILGRCQRAADRAGVPEKEMNAFVEEATAGNYDDLLRTVCKWFDVY